MKKIEQERNENKLIRTEYENKTWDEVTLDKNGRIIHFKNSSGFWAISEFSEDGKELSYKNSEGYFF